MIGLMILWLSSLGLRTYQYSLVWANREELWRHAAAVDPRDSVPYNQLGLAIERAGRHNESLALYDQAIQLVFCPICRTCVHWDTRFNRLLSQREPTVVETRITSALALQVLLKVSAMDEVGMCRGKANDLRRPGSIALLARP